MLTVGRVAAGTGCKYLTEQVAVGKDDFTELSPAQALTYYSDTETHGESPGRWIGRGLPTLGLRGTVTATELENLIGKARHPRYDDVLRTRAVKLLNDRSLSAEQRRTALATAEKDLYLGRGFATYESAAERAERAVADLGEDADEASRDAVRAQVLAEGDRQAVAAYELTFTPVKSVSVLGALGGDDVWRQVLDAHRRAVDTALEYVQDHASYSRAGVNGIRQIDTRGLVIAAFEHRMSRERDPNIHTHAIVANRVQCTDGKWRTVDGRAVYAASVGARAVYEQALETELAQRLGVRFSADERRTIREVHGIPLPVIGLFSKRRAAIEQALTSTLTGATSDDGGRGVERDQVSTGGWRKLARRFTLSTRDRKTGAESTTGAIARWQLELTRAGHDPEQLLHAVMDSAPHDRQPRTDQQVIADAVAVLDQTRAVFTRHHAVLALSRILPPPPDRDFTEHRAHVELLADRLLAESVQVTPPDALAVGPTLRRESDAQNVFTAHADVLYAASSTVAAEQRILAALDDADAPLITAPDLAKSIARVPLGDDQDVAVHAALTTGARISATVGPAGSGKTYLQRAITAAWKARTADPDAPAAGHHDVLALAPSQIAATVLAESTGARAENIAKWLHEHQKRSKHNPADPATRDNSHESDPAWTLRAGQLVIVDEAGMVSTRELDAILTAVRKAGAKLLLVGDDKQLGAIGAGGMFATIVERTNAPVLSTVRRFRDESGAIRAWECAASLGLRNRDLDAIAEYERRGRIHAGPVARMEEASYRAWLTDHLAFQPAAAPGDDRTPPRAKETGVALLMADTEAAAATLSARARTDLVRRGLVEPDGVPLADGNHAGVGDLVVTRLNERRLRARTASGTGDGFVANRDTWRVTDRDRDGSLTVTSVTTSAGDSGSAARELRLPASYVAANVQLAYAGTVHSAQGRTVTTARGLVTESTSAEALYVMMSRGQRSNDAYVVTEDPDREAHQRWPEQHHLTVLADILDRENQPAASVTDVHRDLDEQASSITRLRIIFADLSTVVRGHAYEQIITKHASRDAADRARTDPAWASLVRSLGTAQLRGWDSRQLLIEAITQRELSTAADAAAVLHWRCENITGHARQTPDEPSPAEHDVAATAPLTWRERAIGILDTARADNPAERVCADAADALTQVADAMDARGDALALRLAERAAAGQQGGYDSGATPSWLQSLGPAPTTGPDVVARRAAWLARARTVALYHDAVGYDPASDRNTPRSSEQVDPIGRRPPAGDPEARELWAAARQALAEAPMAATMRAMLPDRLHGWVAEGLRAETRDQPTYVGHELRALSLRARAQRSRVNRLRQETTTAAGMLAAADKRRWRRNETAIASLRRTHDRLTPTLQRGEATLREIERELRAVTDMHQTWQNWEQDTRDIRARARLAAQELGLRGLDTAPDATTASDSATRAALVPGVRTHQSTLPAAEVSAEALAQQYAIQAAAADWFAAQLGQRWARAYLDQRGLTQPATAARVGYAPSRPGHWTLLLDHLRGLGYDDEAIETAGLASRSRHGELIDRFRDRVMLPVLDHANRPIGFLGRKPAGDTDPHNPKYLNPTNTPLYEKSRVLYGLGTDAITRLADGARAIIVEGPMDRLAIQHAADHAGLDLVPIATCGTALTDTHLDLLAKHTSLDRVILGFDPDAAGRTACVAAGRKLTARGVTAAEIETFVSPTGTDAADILADAGASGLATSLDNPEQHGTLLDLLVDEKLDRYDWSNHNRPLHELPLASHAAYEATRFVSETIRDQMNEGYADPTQAQRQLMRISERTGVDPQELNAYMIAVVFPDDDYQPLAIATSASSPNHIEQSAEPELRSEVEADPEPWQRIDDARHS